MTQMIEQTGNVLAGDGDIVAGDKTINHNYRKPTKLSSLFLRLKSELDGNKVVEGLSDDLKRYWEPRDIIGLEEKLKAADKEYLLEDASWLKQEYFKKLTKFQFFEPAQEIHAFLLSLVLEKFRNYIYPMIRLNTYSDLEISRAISEEILDPIVRIIQDEGCDDVMGLSSTDINGMIFFLTGQCHIKWARNDSVSPGI